MSKSEGQWDEAHRRADGHGLRVSRAAARHSHVHPAVWIIALSTRKAEVSVSVSPITLNTMPVASSLAPWL